MRLPFVQVTRFRLTLVGNFSNLAPPLTEIVIYAAGKHGRRHSCGRRRRLVYVHALMNMLIRNTGIHISILY